MADVIFFAEQRDGAFRRAAFESATAARALADALGGASHGVVVGHGVSSIAQELGTYGADQVHVADHTDLASHAPRAVAEIIASVARAVSPGAIVVASSATGKDVAPRVAALLGTGYASDCIGVEVDGGTVRATKPTYAGKVHASLTFASGSPAVVGVRPNVFSPAEAKKSAEVTEVAFEPSPHAFGSRVVELKEAEGDTVDLGEARVVVSGGRGLKGPDAFPMIQALADALGGAMGASRAAVDAGWIDHSHQVGQTGRTVSPDLYIACGISGAIQHLAGMSSARVIVAINRDPEAPIMGLADYAVVGDLFEIVPVLTEKAKAFVS